MDRIPRVQASLLAASALGPGFFVAAVLLGGASRPGYSHLRDPVSSLTEAGSTGSPLIPLLFVLSALMTGLMAIVVVRRYRHRDRAFAAAGILLLFDAAIAILLATVFPQDPIGGALTATGIAHIVLVALSAFAIIGAIVLVGRRLPRAEQGFAGFGAYSTATIAAMLAGGLATPLILALGWPVLGLAERVTQAAYLQWFAVTPLVLARRLRQVPSVPPRHPL
jgi:MFS family permease